MVKVWQVYEDLEKKTQTSENPLVFTLKRIGDSPYICIVNIGVYPGEDTRGLRLKMVCYDALR